MRALAEWSLPTNYSVFGSLLTQFSNGSTAIDVILDETAAAIRGRR